MAFISICFIRFIYLFTFSLIIFGFRLYLILSDYCYFIEWELISLNSSRIVITIFIDWISCLFISFVLLISSLVIYYRKEYIQEDNNIYRFILLVLIFVCSIMLLIISPNMIRILLGWDGLGLVSYCLVIYFQNIKSFNAGILTALSNRIGDVAFLLAIAWILNYGSWNYVFYLDFIKNDFEIKIIGVFIVLAAITKRAQIPFSSWLPAAIAAPTPVSALVHSSTLVTAGVYLLIRFNCLLEKSFLGEGLLLIGCLTMFMAGIGANFEFDLKKIIALSTLSQLGLIMRILSIGFMKLAFFHLLTHALFKALLFICAGSIIHNMKNNQDIRIMGNLIYQIPITSRCLNLANLALCGIPFLAGFYSKDLILEIVILSYINIFSFFIYFISTGLTVGYSFRLVYYSLSGDFNISSLHPISDESWVILRGIFGLLFISLIGGSLLSWLIFPEPLIICLPLILKLLTLIVCFLGGLIGYLISILSIYSVNKSLNYYKFSQGLGLIWYMPVLSTAGVIFLPLKIGFYSIKTFDQGWREFLGGQILYLYFKKIFISIQLLQNNNLKIYLLLFILIFMLLLGLLLITYLCNLYFRV